MADLVTHTTVVLLPALLARWRMGGVCVAGAVLPDVFGRVVPLGLDLVHRHVVPVPEPLIWPWPALHEPLGALATTALLTLSFVPEQRRAAFWAAALGVASHTALDVLQDHQGAGYLLLAPCSLTRLELGLVGSEASVVVAWPLLAATALVAAWRWWSPAETRGV